MEPFDTEEAYAIIARELGAPVSALFAEISPAPVAAASLGQVCLYYSVFTTAFTTTLSLLLCFYYSVFTTLSLLLWAQADNIAVLAKGFPIRVPSSYVPIIRSLTILEGTTTSLSLLLSLLLCIYYYDITHITYITHMYV